MEKFDLISIMASNKEKLLISFASGILRHFNSVKIKGEYNVINDSIQIILFINNKKISTTVPYLVISNAAMNIESLRQIRFEIILELTQGLRTASRKKGNK